MTAFVKSELGDGGGGDTLVNSEVRSFKSREIGRIKK